MKQFADIKLLLLCVILVYFLPKIKASIHETQWQIRKQCSKLGKQIPDPFDCDYSFFLCIEDVNGMTIVSDARLPYKYPYPHHLIPSYPESQCAAKSQFLNICNGYCVNYWYERIADMKDCSVFYTCSPGKVKLKTKCPHSAPYFDGINCQNDKRTCCICCDECTPYCYMEYSQIGDPSDCKSFYICEEKGYPKLKNRYRCEEGKYFDKIKGKCEVEDILTPCTPICKNSSDNYEKFILNGCQSNLSRIEHYSFILFFLLTFILS